MTFKKLLLPLAFVAVLVSCSKTGNNSSTSVNPLDEMSKKKNTPTTQPTPPSCEATINISNCVYIGYGPECTDITVTVPGNCDDYTFEWSSNAGDCGNTPKITVCPSCATTYAVTVTNNSNGAQVTLTKTITPIDVRCGNNNDKVRVCHMPPGNPSNMHEICISPNAVQAHLDHGDNLGACGASCQ